MLRFGRISEIDASNGLVRVSFGADGVESEPIPTIHIGTSGMSAFHTFEVNTLVACIMTDNLAYGCVIGAIYYDDVQPIESSADIVSIVWDNGDKVVYDKVARTMTLKALNGVKVEGDLSVTGSVDATVDITAGPLNTSLTTHIHQVAGVMPGVATIPSNPPT